VFERKLKDGPGGSIYGLEVCEFLGMDTKFIVRAFQVRTAESVSQFTITPVAQTTSVAQTASGAFVKS
jgi:DNA mismatch repair ATPase MutS